MSDGGELVAFHGDIVRPDTGELVSLDDARQVASALEGVRALVRQLHEVRSELEHALVWHAQQAGTKTLHLDGVDAVVSGGPTVEWDVTVLAELVDAGLPPDRYAALVRTEVTYRVDGRVAKQVEASGNPEYARIVAAARSEVMRPWRVAVK